MTFVAFTRAKNQLIVAGPCFSYDDDGTKRYDEYSSVYIKEDYLDLENDWDVIDSGDNIHKSP